MSYESILFSIDGGVGRITLNRPEKLNSFNMQMLVETRRAVASLADTDARVLVITGAGRGFCAGQDIGDDALASGEAVADLGDAIERYYNPLVLALHRLPLPVIAAVNGVAAGAGASVALACDIVIAARSAMFIHAFVKLGLLPDAGGTWALPRLVGTARALGLTLLGDRLPADRAAAWGMIWQCVEDVDLEPTVAALAATLASAPTRALAATKAAIRASAGHTLERQLDLERDAQRELGFTADFREGVAAFGAKRAPVFTGR